MTCPCCQHENAKRFGFYGRKRIQRYRCPSCSSTFSPTQEKPLGNHYIELEKAAQVVSLLVEGMSVRAAARITGVNRNTILSLLLTVGENCRQVLDRRIRGARPRFVQADELWSFVHTKQARVRAGDPKEWGDAYTFLALDAESKLILSYYVGKRDGESALAFVLGLTSRIEANWRCQITTDGFKPYIGAIEEYFGADVDFAQLVKIYGRAEESAREWYTPVQVLDAIPMVVIGKPDIQHVCTSHVERANLSVRMHLRRFTRLTNGFSKTAKHLRAAVALFVAWYNFCRVHQTLRVTPAMETGLTDHVWNIGELLLAK